MKRIIDISEDDLDAIKFLKVKGWASRHELLILDGTPIPDNATNGDVIMTLFPDEHDFETDFDEKWWNSPY